MKMAYSLPFGRARAYLMSFLTLWAAWVVDLLFLKPNCNPSNLYSASLARQCQNLQESSVGIGICRVAFVHHYYHELFPPFQYHALVYTFLQKKRDRFLQQWQGSFTIFIANPVQASSFLVLQSWEVRFYLVDCESVRVMNVWRCWPEGVWQTCMCVSQNCT